MTKWRMEDFAACIPKSLNDCSGKVFYSGRQAFEAPSSIYILGINPGGDHSDLGGETVGKHTNEVLYNYERDWSAYKDEKWPKHQRGSAPLQKRVKHLCSEIGLDAAEVPASNVIFKRSIDFSKLQGDAKRVAKECWPFHRKVIDTLGVRIVVCQGNSAGRYVRKELNAHRQIDKFVECNGRRWNSLTHESPDGFQVVTLAHPSRSDWTKSKTDPTDLVVQAVCRIGE